MEVKIRGKAASNERVDLSKTKLGKDAIYLVLSMAKYFMEC